MRKNPTMGIHTFVYQCFPLKNVFVPRSDIIWDIRSLAQGNSTSLVDGTEHI